MNKVMGVFALATVSLFGGAVAEDEEPAVAMTNGNPMSMSDPWINFADFSLQSNMSGGNLRADKTRNALNFEYDVGHSRLFELNATYERKITPFLSVFGGMDSHHKAEPARDGEHAIAGVRYTLPSLIDLEARIDHTGHARIEVGSAPHLTKHLSFEWKADTDREYRANLKYDITKKLTVTAGYDSTYGAGAGIRFSFPSRPAPASP